METKYENNNKFIELHVYHINKTNGAYKKSWKIN